jgi:hypothetical protein
MLPRSVPNCGKDCARGRPELKTSPSLFLATVAGCVATFGQKAKRYRNDYHSSLLSKHLDQPVNLHITLPGFKCGRCDDHR